jgi:cyanate permease
VLIVAGGLGAVMAPAVLLVVRNPPLAAPVRRPGAAAGHGPTHVATRAEALRDGHFWSFAGPFAIALCVQVGFIFHQIAFLLPLLGPGRTSLAVGAGSVTALAGRLSLGTRVDRMNQRRASAGVFLLQAAGICTMLVLPRSPPALFLGCMLFGLSVGSLVLFPPMIVQREFSPASFGLVVGLSTGVGQLAYALFPGLLGAVHDLTGGYPAVLTLCVVLGLLAAGLIAIPPRRRHP